MMIYPEVKRHDASGMRILWTCIYPFLKQFEARFYYRLQPDRLDCIQDHLPRDIRRIVEEYDCYMRLATIEVHSRLVGAPEWNAVLFMHGSSRAIATHHANLAFAWHWYNEASRFFRRLVSTRTLARFETVLHQMTVPRMLIGYTSLRRVYDRETSLPKVLRWFLYCRNRGHTVRIADYPYCPVAGLLPIQRACAIVSFTDHQHRETQPEIFYPL